LPPYRTVLRPGVGMEPRVPQNCNRKLIENRLGAHRKSVPCVRAEARETVTGAG